MRTKNVICIDKCLHHMGIANTRMISKCVVGLKFDPEASEHVLDWDVAAETVAVVTPATLASQIMDAAVRAADLGLIETSEPPAVNDPSWATNGIVWLRFSDRASGIIEGLCHNREIRDD